MRCIINISETEVLHLKHMVNYTQAYPFLISGRRKRGGEAGRNDITEFVGKLPDYVEPNLQQDCECYNLFSTS